MSNRIALIQMVSSMAVETNLLRLSALMEEAADQGVEAVFLPENFVALAAINPRNIGSCEADASGPVRSHLSNLAKTFDVWIFGGTMPTTIRPDGTSVTPPRVRAASFVYDSSGVEVARYDKIHMFDVEVDDDQKHYVESSTFEPGEDVVSLDSPLGKIGLTVCYDIRFPELYRKLFVSGVRSFSIPSAFTVVTGEAHFEVLMRSRAIENFCFTIAACQGGEHDSGRKTYGHSMVVSPWGEILVRGSIGEEVLVAELDFERQDEIRASMPVHLQRKFEV